MDLIEQSLCSGTFEQRGGRGEEEVVLVIFSWLSMTCNQSLENRIYQGFSHVGLLMVSIVEKGLHVTAPGCSAVKSQKTQ